MRGGAGRGATPVTRPGCQGGQASGHFGGDSLIVLCAFVSKVKMVASGEVTAGGGGCVSLSPAAPNSGPLSAVGGGQGLRVTGQSTSVPPWPAFGDPKPASLRLGPTPSCVSCLGCLGLVLGRLRGYTGWLAALDVWNTLGPSGVPCGSCGMSWQEPGVGASPACPKPRFSSSVVLATSFS